MMFDSIGLVMIGMIVLVFHYYLKWNLKYLDSLPGSIIYKE
jgi:hypothetical protein